VRDLTLADFPFMASLASSDDPKDRRIWLRVASDYFVAAEPSDSDAITRFAEAMAAQLDGADPATRMDVARRLASSPRTPLRLLMKLEASGAEVSDYVLEHAAAFTPGYLASLVAAGGKRAVAVAKRKDLSSELQRALAERADVEALIALARNSEARLEGAALAQAIGVARQLADAGDRRLAEALLARRPVRPETAALFLHADAAERVEILLAEQRMQLGRPPGAPPADAGALDALELAAVARQPARFVAVLAEALECEPELARRIADDVSGEPLAVALTALGAPNEVLVRVLISNDLLAGASYQRIRALARLNNALNRNAAVAVVDALRERGGRRPPQRTEAVAPAADARPLSARLAARPAPAPKRALGR